MWDTVLTFDLIIVTSDLIILIFELIILTLYSITLTLNDHFDLLILIWTFISELQLFYFINMIDHFFDYVLYNYDILPHKYDFKTL